MRWTNLMRRMTGLAGDLGNRRAERIRSWRRRALSRKGAQLYSAMQAGWQPGSLAMLDEGGMVIAWYERAEPAAATDEHVIDTHMSQFYVAEDQALGVPVRDLCSATIHGRSTQTGWRRFPRGGTCWATTVIEPIRLRDGRLQGYSHVTRRASAAPDQIRVEKPTPILSRRSVAHALAHSMAMLAVVTLLFAGNVTHAQSAVVDAVPEHARKMSRGGGWECDTGYRRTDKGCVQVVVPANAYLDASGNNWSCDRGFRNVNNACVEVRVPSNAYLDDSYGQGWRCERGYREGNGDCAAVQVPVNAYAVESSYGSGWQCNRGFQLISGKCEAIVVPGNGYLNDRGDDWKCERGFKKVGAACAAVAVPANGYLDRQGNSWICERGFKPGATSCEAIALPENSHLSYSGDSWRCDRGFSRQAERCLRD